ncbi:carbohydrate ABC transporter permease [Cohnella candidum]|uniref:Sugar ABC transporter permease n=1 Tax=Cohnella candidum TaxID=2674991 RepID=A0A3G3K1T1_9BACL|nr:sugar ABC transporter permease [Cohnella candidum]AYQ74466.1 sugar ABC transporter permease [Cohnella candidum]
MRTKLARRRSEGLIPYLFLAPWMIGVLAFSAIPIFTSLYLSFTNYNFVGTPNWIGLRNYITMFTNDPQYLQSLKVTFTYVFVAVPLELAFALSLAMLLNRGISGLGMYRSLYYMPSLIGGSVAVAILWRQVFGEDGIVNQALGIFGIDMPSWIGTPSHAVWALILLKVWQFGSPMIIFLAGLKQIPNDFYEASSLDGAGRWKQFAHITLPMLTPIVLFNAIMQMISSFQAFTPAYVISEGTGGPVNSTLFYTLYLYQNGFGNFQMGYASSMAWVLFIIIGVFTWLAFQSSNKWVHYDN